MIEPEKLSAPMTLESIVVSVKSNGSGRRSAGRDASSIRHRDERRRAAAAAVEDRDHLRHRGHLHARAEVDADRRADDEAER
jgi:hypothetical protein